MTTFGDLDVERIIQIMIRRLSTQNGQLEIALNLTVAIGRDANVNARLLTKFKLRKFH